MAIINKVEELWKQWEAEGKVKTIPREEVQASNERINREMEKVRLDNMQKAHQSQIEASKIVLNG